MPLVLTLRSVVRPSNGTHRFSSYPVAQRGPWWCAPDRTAQQKATLVSGSAEGFRRAHPGWLFDEYVRMDQRVSR